MNSIRVLALLGQMHLGLKTGPLCLIFCTELKEPCSFSKVPDVSYYPLGPKKEPRYYV